MNRFQMKSKVLQLTYKNCKPYFDVFSKQDCDIVVANCKFPWYIIEMAEYI